MFVFVLSRVHLLYVNVFYQFFENNVLCRSGKISVVCHFIIF